MNNVAILPYICLHALQIQNVKRNIVKKVSIDELKNEVIHPVEHEDLINTHNVENNTTDDLQNQSTNIDDLPQPSLSEINIGTEL